MSELTFFEVVKGRRSVRKYRPDPIPREHIHKIIEAASLSPTAGNQQPWVFLILQDPKRIEEIKALCIELRFEQFSQEKKLNPSATQKTRLEVEAYYQDFLSAPLYILVLTDTRSPYPMYNLQDGTLAAGTICLAARALGYGSVYTTESIFESATRQVCHIPDYLERVCAIPIGVPDRWPRRHPKKDYKNLIIDEVVEN